MTSVRILATFWAVAFSLWAQNPEPDYSNVTDILNGRRTMLRDDDILVSFSSNGSPQTWVYQTKNLALSQPVVNTSAPTACNQLMRPARLFRLQNTVIVSLGQPNGCASSNANIYVTDPQNSANNTSLPVTLDQSALQLSTGDFMGDGLDELIVGDGQNIILYGAIDPDTPSKGLKELSRISVASGSRSALAIGDFNGDGAMDIASITEQDNDFNATYQAKFVSVCPASNVKILVQTCASAFQMISVGTSLPLGTTSGCDGCARKQPPQVIAGNFLGIASQAQLISEAQIETGGYWHQLDGWTFDADFSAIHKSSFTTPGSATDDPVYWAAASLNWFASNQQLVYTTFDSFAVYVFTFDSALGMTPHSTTTNNSSACWAQTGLSVGRYDPPGPDSNSTNFNLQIAVMFNNCNDRGGRTTQLRFYTVSPPDDFTPKEVLSKVIADSWPPGVTTDQFGNIAQPAANLLYAGDTQGRSVALGEPTKIVLENSVQPSVVVAMPPMHVDYMPKVAAKAPTLLNVSLDPDGFYTSYQTEDTRSDQSSTTNSHSWSFGAQETFSGSLEIGSVEDKNGLEIKDTTTAAQNLKHNVDIEHSSYSTHTFNVSQETGLADQVWSTQSRLNIYVYPIIGKTVCPSTKPNCQASEKVPLTVQFSAPDQTDYYTVAGDQLAWYQPPWEYGNVLSYPASYFQLQQIVPNIQKLSNDLTWFTDSSSLTQMTNWTAGTSGGSTTSYNQNYSFENTLSVVGSFGGKIAAVGGSFALNLGGSFGFNDLNQSTTKLGKSTGIGVTKPGTSLDPNNYGYFVTPYIFGEVQPSSVVDATNPAPADVQSFSLLRTAFVVDPLRNDAGGWWKQMYTSAPDVALNHPSRWLITRPALPEPIPDNCRPVAAGNSQMNCVTLAPSYPDNPWVSSFHFMRGFFISREQSPGQGPQLQSATAGDKLRLQARVYNYSLKQMPADAIVHVLFYVQPWNTQNMTPLGDSVLAGHDKLGPIPPFNTAEDAPLNWVLANTTFDTTSYGNQNLTFWVVVWMEDGSGKLVPEIGGHGLKSIPGPLKSLAGVQTEEYSNNVGFYKSVFYVFPQESLGERSAAGLATINLGKIDLSARRAAPGQTVEVSALLSARDNGARGVTAVFYDGDPHTGGKVFGVDRAPYVAADHDYLAKALYQPKSCGVHELFVVIGKDTPAEILRRSAPLRILCSEAFERKKF